MEQQKYGGETIPQYGLHVAHVQYTGTTEARVILIIMGVVVVRLADSKVDVMKSRCRLPTTDAPLAGFSPPRPAGSKANNKPTRRTSLPLCQGSGQRDRYHRHAIGIDAAKSLRADGNGCWCCPAFSARTQSPLVSVFNTQFDYNGGSRTASSLRTTAHIWAVYTFSLWTNEMIQQQQQYL